MNNDSKNSKISTCHACGGVVSKSAKTCPHCGQKRPYQPKTNWKRIYIYSGVGFVLWCFLSIFALLSSNPDYKTTPSPQNKISLEVAINACEKGIRASTNNPSTVDIQRFTGFGQNIEPDGTRRITQSFSAKNSFGLKVSFDAYCSLTPSGKFDIKIKEQGR